MAIRELDPGQSHVVPGQVALRAELVGSTQGVLLRAVDQADHEEDRARLNSTTLLLIPKPRRLRLVVSPALGGTFPGGTNVGLALRTEGQVASPEEVLVARVDVGALDSYELAVVEFADNRVILSVPSGSKRSDDRQTPPDQHFISGDRDTVVAPPPRPAPPSETEYPWLKRGLYALREAETLARLGRVDEQPPAAWSLVLDGSVSMRRLHSSGKLDELLVLAAGVMVQWTGRWPSRATVAGVRVTDAPAGVADPYALTHTAFHEATPSSWAAVGSSTAAALDQMGAGCAVVVVTDGVPGDLDQLVAAARRSAQSRVSLVVIGTSATLGLSSDRHLSWWEDELVALEEFASLPNAQVVAVRLDGDQLALGGDRAAEVALLLTREQRVSA